MLPYKTYYGSDGEVMYHCRIVDKFLLCYITEISLKQPVNFTWNKYDEFASYFKNLGVEYCYYASTGVDHIFYKMRGSDKLSFSEAKLFLNKKRYMNKLETLL